MLHRPSSQLDLARQLPALWLGALGGALALAVAVGGQAAVLQLRAGFEGLYAPLLALNLRVGAGEEERDVRADLVAERGLGGGEC